MKSLCVFWIVVLVYLLKFVWCFTLSIERRFISYKTIVNRTRVKSVTIDITLHRSIWQIFHKVSKGIQTIMLRSLDQYRFKTNCLYTGQCESEAGVNGLQFKPLNISGCTTSRTRWKCGMSEMWRGIPVTRWRVATSNKVFFTVRM